LSCSKYEFTYIKIALLLVIAVPSVVYHIPNTTVSGTIDSISNNGTPEKYTETTKSELQEIPTNVTVIPRSLDRGFLILSAVNINDTLIHYTRDLNDEISPFLLTDRNQSLRFLIDYGHLSEEQNFTLTNLLIGPIGNFTNFDSLLRETKWFRDVPLRLNLAIELPVKGVSFMLAELKVSDDMSGLYYGNFEASQASEDDSRIKDSKNTLVSQLKSNGPLYNVTQKLVCNDLNKFSYDTCK
jgi:hypothetical protein